MIRMNVEKLVQDYVDSLKDKKGRVPVCCYDEDSGESYTLADMIEEQLAAEGVESRVRLRSLGRNYNAKALYLVSIWYRYRGMTSPREMNTFIESYE